MISKDSVNKNQQWQELVFKSFLQILRAPYGDFGSIWNLANVINDEDSLRETITLLSCHAPAKSAIQSRFLLGMIDLQQLNCLPKETLGYIYSEHMLRNGLKLIPCQTVKNDFDYLMVHLTEVHDIWHVVINADTSMAGETKLQAFVAAQLRNSRFSFAMLAKNLLKASVEDLVLAEQLMNALTAGWLLGKQSQPIFGIRWDELWEVPLTKLQEQLAILPKISS